MSKRRDSPSKDFGRRFYLISTIFVCLCIALVVWLGEWWSYKRAVAYVHEHRKKGEPWLIDASGTWLRSKPKGLQVTTSRKGFPYGTWRAGRSVWLLEHKKTGIRSRLPPKAFCETKRSFGPLKYYHLRRCWLLSGRPTDLRHHLRRATILNGEKRCRWSRGACRFGPSWQRVESRHYFRSGHVSRSCIYAHPHSRRWMSLRFPPMDMSGGARVSFGIQDGYGGKVPLRVMFRFYPQPKGAKHPGSAKVLLDVTIPHKAEWHRHFLSPSRLPSGRGQLEFRMWTRHHGAKPFCFRALLFSSPKRPKLRLLRHISPK